MKIPQSEWATMRQQFLTEIARRGVRLVLRDRVWAVTRTGGWIALPGTSDSPITDRWWLGCDPEKLRARRTIGVILLCQARSGSLHAIGLPVGFFRSLESKLSRNTRQVFFNVVRRGGRFLLQLRGGEEIDVTRRIDDLSWVGADHEALAVSEGVDPLDRSERVREELTTQPADDDCRGRTEEASTRFFAVFKNEALRPLDDVVLKPGSFYLVEAREAQAVPDNASLRRILARGGPDDLPADFAERHDYYAHGSVRR